MPPRSLGKGKGLKTELTITQQWHNRSCGYRRTCIKSLNDEVERMGGGRQGGDGRLWPQNRTWKVLTFPSPCCGTGVGKTSPAPPPHKFPSRHHSSQSLAKRGQIWHSWLRKYVWNEWLSKKNGEYWEVEGTRLFSQAPTLNGCLHALGLMSTYTYHLPVWKQRDKNIPGPTSQSCLQTQTVSVSFKR